MCPACQAGRTHECEKGGEMSDSDRLMALLMGGDDEQQEGEQMPDEYSPANRVNALGDRKKEMMRELLAGGV